MIVLGKDNGVVAVAFFSFSVVLHIDSLSTKVLPCYLTNWFWLGEGTIFTKAVVSSESKLAYCSPTQYLKLVTAKSHTFSN